ncbi:hypothetical protein [Duganella sp. HH101]|uniref:hypothetical protein n=1 Tax=Duganella sp. HH101 TaxID=1781066 RepID=UPI0008756601|nr:hypothetical protein [Duganella sp. HH101]OFA02013.1 hypothetical protein DUGA2_39390 [Duganella sp. HH101]
MLSLEDAQWKEFHGGYRIPYDASVALRSMQDGMDVWDELWNELHHQGDVDVASYAVVPQMVRIAAGRIKRDWNFYGLVATIEVARHRKDNPTVPEWLRADYDSALTKASGLALVDINSAIDSDTTCAILSVLALAKGELKLGAMLSGLDESELDEWLEERLAWSDLYEE